MDMPMLDDLGLWVQAFLSPTVLVELAVLAVCVGLAWGLVALLQRGLRQGDPRSILFGVRIVDGALFPLVLLSLAYIARTLLHHWVALAAFKIAIPVLVALVVIRIGVKVLQVAYPDAAWVRPIERSISWMAWLGMVLWVTGLLPLVLDELDQIHWKVGGATLSVRTIIEGAVTAGAVLLIALWISAAIESRLLRSATGAELSLRKAVSNAVRALLVFVGLLVALSSVGIDLTALSVLGGAVGVGIGFGLQKLASNYVSGFVMLLERSLRIGDNVRVDGFEGRIADITTRYTLIRANNGREAIVPNETFITQRVENLSIQDKKFNITSNIVVGYDSNVAQVQAILVAAATAQPRVLVNPAPVAFLANFAPDGIEFSLNFWINDPDAGQGGLKSAVNIAMLEGLRAAAIAIPFPQRVLHVQRGAEPSPVAAPESQA